MKIKNLLSSICAVSCVALSFVACSDYDNGYTEEQLRFIQGFKDVFGEIDHSNDWNLAERGSVTVTTSKPSNVKIYANTFGTYQIVGDYKDVSGTRTLGFDMVEGTTDILVSDGHSSQKVNVGDAVIFSGTRYVYTGSESKTNEDGSPIVSVGDVEEYFDYDTYIKIVTDPETGHLPEEKQNLGKITQNFTYVSQGPFTIYPLHVESSSCHILGVYWRDGDADDTSKENLKTQLVYRNNGQHNPTDEWRHPTWEDNKDWEDNNKEDEDNNNNKDGNKYSSDDVFAKPITINLPPGTVFGFYIEVYKGEITYDDDGTMHFPNEYDEKFYHCLYSAAARNAEQKGEPLDETTTLTVSENSAQLIRYIENGLTAFAGTFRTSVVNEKGEDEEICYLGFEDWATDKVFDLNDLVFIIKGDPLPVILDEDPTSWVLSAEDLGGTFDIDYNDVVIKVSHISGKQDLMVEPLAAGGTLASYLYFNDGLVETEEDLSIGEIHSFFGQGTTISGNYKPVNVTADDIDEDGKPLRTAIIPDDSPLKDLKVSEDWSLASFTPNTASANAKELAKNRTMGGFYVKVVPQGLASDEKNVREQVNENGDKVIQRIQNTVERNEDNVPYIICTPYNWRRSAKDENGNDLVYAGTYRWPREHVPMFPFGDFQDKGAYHNTSDPAHSFKSWVRGRYDENNAHIQTSVYWYRYPDIDLTVGEKIPALAEDGGNTGNGGTGGDNKTDFPQAGTYEFHTISDGVDYVLAYDNNTLCIKESSDNNPCWNIEYKENDFFTLTNDNGEYVCLAGDMGGWMNTWDATLKSALPENSDLALHKFEIYGINTYKIYNKYNDDQGASGKYFGVNNGTTIYLSNVADGHGTLIWTLKESADTNTKKRKVNVIKKKE